MRLSHLKGLTVIDVGAAGNFLATIDGMSENAFRTVLEIDTVSSELKSIVHIHPHFFNL